MGLGKYLVKELGFEKGHDVLGRWMAHHVAGLIKDTEKASNPKKRTQARKEAEKTILKIWDKRYQLPGNAYPLAQYKDIVAILDVIRPGGNPWRSGYSSDKKMDKLTAAMFDEFSRLIIILIFFQAPIAKIGKITPVSFENLNPFELRTLLGIRQIFQAYQTSQETSKPSKRAKKKKNESGEKLSDGIVRLIDETIGTLSELKSEFREEEKSKTTKD